MVFQNQFHHLHCVHMSLICWSERCNLHDGCQPTLELCTLCLDVVSVHHHQTPALTGSEFQGWKCSANIQVNCHTTKLSAWQSFQYHYHCTQNPLNSMINWLLHHLLHVTSIVVSTSHHKIKGLLKNYRSGNLTYWTGFVHRLSLSDNVEEYTESIFCWPVKITTKAVPLQAWSGPEGSKKLRFPECMTTAQDGGKVVSPTHRPPLRPGNTPGTHFC